MLWRCCLRQRDKLLMQRCPVVHILQSLGQAAKISGAVQCPLFAVKWTVWSLCACYMKQRHNQQCIDIGPSDAWLPHPDLAKLLPITRFTAGENARHPEGALPGGIGRTLLIESVTNLPPNYAYWLSDLSLLWRFGLSPWRWQTPLGTCNSLCGTYEPRSNFRCKP